MGSEEWGVVAVGGWKRRVISLEFLYNKIPKRDHESPMLVNYQSKLKKSPAGVYPMLLLWSLRVIVFDRCSVYHQVAMYISKYVNTAVHMSVVSSILQLSLCGVLSSHLSGIGHHLLYSRFGMMCVTQTPVLSFLDSKCKLVKFPAV